MSKWSRLNLPVWLFLGLPLGVALLVGGWNRSQSSSLTAVRLEEGWELSQVLAQLHAHGLPFRAVAVERDGIVRHSAFLTRTGKNWAELTSLPKAGERIELWEGTVYCERVGPQVSRTEQIQFWGDHCLDAGTFVFFGDRKLLDQIRAALRASFS